jgi:hypothetical protein
MSFNFINTLMVVCVIQLHQNTYGGVSTISVLMKLDDALHHQYVDAIK